MWGQSVNPASRNTLSNLSRFALPPHDHFQGASRFRYCWEAGYIPAIRRRPRHVENERNCSPEALPLFVWSMAFPYCIRCENGEYDRGNSPRHVRSKCYVITTDFFVGSSCRGIKLLDLFNLLESKSSWFVQFLSESLARLVELPVFRSVILFFLTLFLFSIQWKLI